MGKYNFDAIIDRTGTGAMKYDALQELFGCNTLTPLWIADMEFAAAPCISEALTNRFAHPVYGYSSTPDSYWESIIEWLDRRHGFRPDRSWLSFVPGVVRGIAYALNFFSRPGDKVVIQPPVYHPFRSVAEGNNRVVVENPLLLVEEPQTHYEMDLEGLEQIFINERPRMMILCNPHNPVGIQWDEATLRRVAELAKRHNVIVISDEIHGDLMLYGGHHYPFATVSEAAAEVSITFGAPSKTFNIPGLVSSWMIVPNPELRNPFYHWMEVNEFSVPFFSATVGTEAAYRGGEEWLEELLEYLEGNIAALEKYIARELPGVKSVRPQASFLVWLDFRALGLTQKELVERIVDRAGLALNDGAMFGAQGQGFMRLNIAMPRKCLIKALSRFKEIL